MGITIEELLHSEDLPQIKLIAGRAGIRNSIELTNVTDSDELHKWLTGQELILSNGLIFKGHMDRMAPMIRNLHRAGASGMLIKMGRYITTIPYDAVDMANACGFPLMAAPEDLHFSDVNRLLSRHASQVAQSTQRYAAFSALLEREAGIPAYLRLLSKYLSADVVYYDNMTTKLFRSRKGCEAPDYDTPEQGPFLRENRSYPVQAGKDLYGTLVVLCRGDFEKELDTLTIHYVVNMLSITSQKRLPSRFRDAGWLERFVGELLRGDTKIPKDEILRCGRLCGYSFFSDTTVAVAIPDDRREGTLQRVEQLLQKLQKPEKTLLLLWENRIVLFHGQEAPAPRLQAFCEEAVKLCRQQNIPISIGIGGTRNSPQTLHQSYQEAVKAITVGVQFTGSGVYTHGSLGWAGFLYAYARTEEAKEAVAEIIGKLMEYDKKKPSYALLPTLQALTRCGFNLTQAAAELYIHYNTLKYRYTKICEITGLELSKFQDQAQAFLALSLLQVQTLEEDHFLHLE